METGDQNAGCPINILPHTFLRTCKQFLVTSSSIPYCLHEDWPRRIYTICKVVGKCMSSGVRFERYGRRKLAGRNIFHCQGVVQHVEVIVTTRTPEERVTDPQLHVTNGLSNTSWLLFFSLIFSSPSNWAILPFPLLRVNRPHTPWKRTSCVYFHDPDKIFFRMLYKILFSKTIEEILANALVESRTKSSKNCTYSSNASPATPYAGMRKAAVMRCNGCIPYLLSPSMRRLKVPLPNRARTMRSNTGFGNQKRL